MHPEVIETGLYDSHMDQVKKIRRLKSANNTHGNRKISTSNYNFHSERETEFL